MAKLDRKTKELFKEHVIRIFKENGYRHGKGYIYKKHGENVVNFFVNIYINARTKELCTNYEFYIKKYSYDDIWANVLGDGWEWLHNTLALRVSGAFVVDMIRLGGKIIKPTEDMEQTAKNVYLAAERALQDFENKYTVNEFVLKYCRPGSDRSDCEYPHMTDESYVLCTLAYLDEMKTDLAVQTAKEALREYAPEDILEATTPGGWVTNISDQVRFFMKVIEKYGSKT